MCIRDRLFASLTKAVGEVAASMAQHAIVKRAERANCVALAEGAIVVAYNLWFAVGSGGPPKASLDALKSVLSGNNIYVRELWCDDKTAHCCEQWDQDHHEG